jgi:hypothetical protein
LIGPHFVRRFGVLAETVEPAKKTPGFVALVLVEPGVYARPFALDYQAERFAIFHRSALTRWTHYLGTPAMLSGFFLLAWGHQLGPAPAPLILGAVLCAWYLRLNVLVGLAASLELCAFAAVAWRASVYGWGAMEACLAIGGLAAALNVSHSVEPVPPVLTGRGFESFAVYWARASALQRVRLLALNLFYVPLEVVSAPRLFPVHVLRALHAGGWRRAWSAEVEARAERVLCDVTALPRA